MEEDSYKHWVFFRHGVFFRHAVLFRHFCLLQALLQAWVPSGVGFVQAWIFFRYSVFFRHWDFIRHFLFSGIVFFSGIVLFCQALAFMGMSFLSLLECFSGSGLSNTC